MRFFIQKLALLQGTTPLLSGRASKGACQWLNFYRNVNLTADAGAGGYVYHVMKKTDHKPTIKLPGFPDDIAGVLRYEGFHGVLRWLSWSLWSETSLANQSGNAVLLFGCGQRLR